MPIRLKRRNGEETAYRNSEYIPAFYYLPESILRRCDAEIRNLPRHPWQLFHDWNAIAMVESDYFRLCIIDAYAYMVWPYMGLGKQMEIYSGYDPAWKFAHCPDYWIYELQEAGAIPTVEYLFRNCTPQDCFGFVPEDLVAASLANTVPTAMERNDMDLVIATAMEYRCFEDFDQRKSSQKTDFIRKWYHTRTRHPQISLEGYMEEYAERHDGQQFEVPDNTLDVELEVTSKVQVEDFLKTLSEKDKQILTLRMAGIGLEKIAEQLDFKTHSAVLKRLRKIGLAYEQYSGLDLGFSQPKITG